MDRQYLVAWAAGFIDGEGCISIWPKNEMYYALRLTVFQIVREPLDILQGLFGGSVRPRKASGTSKAGWIWDIGSKPIISALTEVLPFLVVKKTQARLAIEFQSRKASKGRKYENYAVERELNERDYVHMKALKVAGVL